MTLLSATARARAAEDGDRLEHDFNGDGFNDLLTLEETGGRFLKLNVFLTSGTPQPVLQFANERLVTDFSSLAEAGSRLHLAKSGDLIIVTYNEAVGRERWNYQRKFSFGKDGFALSLLTYRSRDLFKTDDRYDCRIDFATGKGTIDGKQVALAADPTLLTLKDLSDAALGRPFDLCQDTAAGKTAVSFAVHQMFQAYRPNIEKALPPGVILAQVTLHTGDLNSDGLEDAVVSFAQVSAKHPDLVFKREAAIYINDRGTMRIDGALPETSCNTKVTGIAAGKILTEQVSCGGESH